MNSESPVLLPHAHILSYISVTDSPPRVRTVAARMVLILGLLHLLAGIGSFLVIACYAEELFRDLAALEWESSMIALIILFPYLICIGILLLACSGHVRRGKKIACQLASASLLPLMPALLVAGATVGTVAIIDGLALSAGAPHYQLLFLCLVTPISGLIFLVCLDLLRFLRWIARNPITELPPVPFIPPAKNVTPIPPAA